MKFFTGLVAGLASLASVNASSLGRRQGGLQQVSNFGDNPSGVKMYIYVPSQLAENPAIIVAVHYCTGTAQGYYNGSPYARLADQKGFIAIYPESPYSGTCWDVSSPASLSHDGTGNSYSIANMVAYTIEEYNADPAKVFVTGSSSGAMMTVSLQVLNERLYFRPLTFFRIERPRCYISRRFRSWYCLLWCAGRLLRVLIRTGEWVELDLCQRPVEDYSRALGPGGEGYVPRIRWSASQDADLPRQCRHNPRST